MNSIDSSNNNSNSNTLKLPLKDAVKVLHPLTHHVEVRYRNRFSMLLLEHGEQHLQDWAVVASSSVVNNESTAAIYLSKNAKKTEWNKSAKQGRKKAYSHSHGNENNGYGSTIMGKLEGRLHLCSRSIVFEPLETSRGIIRCPFNRMETSPRERSSSTTSTTNPVAKPTMQRQTSTSNALFGSFEAIASLSIEFVASRHLIMKENNVIGPFESIEIPTNFGFTFLHSCPEMFVELCQVRVPKQLIDTLHYITLHYITLHYIIFCFLSHTYLYACKTNLTRTETIRSCQ